MKEGSKPSVYLETTVISYLTSRPSRDLVVAANQEVTRQWWEGRRARFALFVSPVVKREAARGDGAPERLAVLEAIPSLELTETAATLAVGLVERRVIPAKATDDAFHLAVAAVHGIDVLLTWNCTHIANPFVWRQVERVFVKEGYDLPAICTPFELLGDNEQ